MGSGDRAFGFRASDRRPLAPRPGHSVERSPETKNRGTLSPQLHIWVLVGDNFYTFLLS